MGGFDHSQRAETIAEKLRRLTGKRDDQVGLLNHHSAQQKAFRDDSHVIRRAELHKALFDLLVNMTQQVGGDHDMAGSLELMDRHSRADGRMLAADKARVGFPNNVCSMTPA